MIETPERIMLRYSQRGMDKLAPYLPEDYCKEAAKQLLALERGTILLTTGFFVEGHAETDGPPGTAVLALALKRLGFSCVILTDRYCEDFFSPLGLSVRYLESDQICPQTIIREYDPVALISIERCGKNEDGRYQNMRRKDISDNTAPLDLLFPFAREQGILTVGVGDGGNEIGMGELQEQIRQELELDPCVVSVDRLILASVSNWGAYGLAAWLSKLTGQTLMDNSPWLELYLHYLRRCGCVDGVTHALQTTVDGYPAGTEGEIYEALYRWASPVVAANE